MSSFLAARSPILEAYGVELLVELKAHSGFVKGVCWDPVGEFLATQVRTAGIRPLFQLRCDKISDIQSNDKTVKIWSTQTWECIHTVSKTFAESGIGTIFRRLRSVVCLFSCGHAHHETS